VFIRLPVLYSCSCRSTASSPDHGSEYDAARAQLQHVRMFVLVAIITRELRLRVIDAGCLAKAAEDSLSVQPARKLLQSKGKVTSFSTSCTAVFDIIY
jgi:hypothetical protein